MNRRVLKIFGIGASLFVAALALLLALPLLGFFPQSTARIALWAGGRAAGYELVCEEFEGNIFSTSICRRFSASDAEGAFFHARTIEFGWQLFPIFGGRLNIDHLRIANAALDREPQSESAGAPSSLPTWPGVVISLGEFSVQRFSIGIPDTPMVCLNGTASGEIAEPILALNMQFARCAGEGTIAALARINGEQLNIDLEVMDDGDLAALLLGWDGAGATNIRLVGAGPLRAFSGTLDAQIENGGTASLNVGTLGTDNNAVEGIGIDGGIVLAEGRAPSWAPATNGSVSAQIYFGEQGALRIENGALIWGNAQLDFVFSRSDVGALSAQLDANIGPYDGPVAFQSAQLSLNVQGDADVQTASGNYLFGQFCSGQYCADELAGDLQLNNTDLTIAFATAGNASALRITGILDEILGERSAYNFAGNFARSDDRLDIEGMLQGAQGDLRVNGQMTFTGGTSGNADVALAINENAIIGDTMIPAALVVSADALQFGPDGRVSANLSLASDMLDASGSFQLAANDALAVVLESTRTDAALLSEGLGVSFAMPPSLRVSAMGTSNLPVIQVAAQMPALDLGGFALTDLQWNLDARRSEAAWMGESVLGSQSAAGRIDLNARINWPEGAPLEIILTDSHIAEATVEGSVSIPLGGAPPSANFTVAGNALSPLGHYLERPAASAGPMIVKYETRGDAAIVTIDLALEDIALGEQLSGAVAQGNIVYEIAARRASANLRLREGMNALEFGANADFAAETIITVDSLDGNWASIPFRLLEPATLRQSTASARLAGAVLAIGNGRGEISGFRDETSLEANVALNAIPVAPFMDLQGYPAAQGVINATVNVRMTPTESAGDLTLSLADFAFENIERDLVPADLSARGSWNGTEFRIDGEISGLDEAPATFSASLPLRRTGEGYAVTIEQNSPVTGSFSGTARAERFLALLPIAEHSLTGAISASLQLNGTPAEPHFTGQARLQDGTYESLQLGTRLVAVNIDLNAAADGAFSVDASASDGGAGRLLANGRMSFDENAQPIGNGTITITDAYLAQRDEYTARGSGEIGFDFPEGETGSIAGMFRTSEVRVDLGQPLPPGVDEIAVIELNRPAELGVYGQEEVSQEAEFIRVASLDIDIVMPNNVRVEGYGVNAEWQGNISIGGTVGAPAIGGEVTLVRGFADFLGRQFTLDEGRVVPDPNAAGNARVAITGSHVQGDLSVEVSITGPAASPEITWSSVPALPRDEIISRLYFGRASPQLSAYEAIQLAQLSGALGDFGGGGGILDFARQMAGLDVLRIEAPENGDISNPTVTVGKYVTDRVYVGAKRDADTSSSAIEVDIDITPNISAEVETGTDNNQAAAVNWHWHY